MHLAPYKGSLQSAARHCLYVDYKKPDNPHRNRDKFFKKLDNVKDENILQYISKMSRERLARRILNKLRG